MRSSWISMPDKASPIVGLTRHLFGQQSPRFIYLSWLILARAAHVGETRSRGPLNVIQATFFCETVVKPAFPIAKKPSSKPLSDMGATKTLASRRIDKPSEP